MPTPPFLGQGYIPSSGAITNELNAVTRRAFIPKLVVQIYQAAPLLSLMIRNAQRAAGGLNQVTIPIQNAQLVNASWTDYSGGFPIPATQTAIQDAGWNLSILVTPIPLLGTESATQSTEAVVPLIRARFADAKTVMVQTLSSALYSRAAATTSNNTAINGLPDIYDDGTNTATYGGINRSSVPQWKGGYYTSSITPGRATMLTQLAATTYAAGGEEPDIVIMSPSDWATLMEDFLTQEQFRTDPTMRYGKDDPINAGFSCVMLANTPFLADPFCPKGTAYVINSKYLSLFISEWMNFAWSGWYSQIPNGQLANIGVVLAGMALVCSKPSSGRQLSTVAGGQF